MFLESWDVTIDLRGVFDFSDIENIRVKLANSLFFSPTNLVDKALVNFFYEQVFIGSLLSLINFFLLLSIFLLIIFFVFVLCRTLILDYSSRIPSVYLVQLVGPSFFYLLYLLSVSILQLLFFFSFVFTLRFKIFQFSLFGDISVLIACSL